MTKIQSIIFSKDKFTRARAEAWLRKHKYKVTFRRKRVHITAKTLRYRQTLPKKNAKYRIITFAPGIKAVIEI